MFRVAFSRKAVLGFGCVAGFGRFYSSAAEAKQPSGKASRGGITSVSVRPGMAEVTRLATAKAGEGVVTIEGLKGVDVSSLRASCPGGGQVVAVDTEVCIKDGSDGALQQQLKDTISHLQNEISRLNDEAQSFKSVMRQVDGFCKRHSATDLQEFIKMTESASEYMLSTQRKVTKNEAELEALESKLSQVKAQLAEATAASKDSSTTVRVKVADCADGVVELTYAVRYATWTPHYEARVADGVLDLHYQAKIRQWTGEDWDDCEIKLMTKNPDHTHLPPTPKILVGPYAHPFSRLKKSAMAAGGMSGGGGFKKESCAPLDDCIEVEAAIASEDSLGLTSTVTLPGPVTIPSDSQDHKFGVAVLGLETSLLYFITPEKASQAYLRGSCKNTSDYQILSSECDVYIDGALATKGVVPDAEPGEEFHMFLGADKGIKVTHTNTKKDRVGNSSFLSTGKKKVETTRVTEAVVTNNKRSSVDVAVVFQVPESTDSRVEVELVDPPRPSIAVGALGPDDSLARVSFTNSGITRNSDTNNLIWTTPIDSASTSKFGLTYTVTHPADMTLSYSTRA